jgi:hypothetical protein
MISTRKYASRVGGRSKLLRLNPNGKQCKKHRSGNPQRASEFRRGHLGSVRVLVIARLQHMGSAICKAVFLAFTQRGVLACGSIFGVLYYEQVGPPRLGAPRAGARGAHCHTNGDVLGRHAGRERDCQCQRIELFPLHGAPSNYRIAGRLGGRMMHRTAASKAVPAVRAGTNQSDALFCFARSMVCWR